MGDYNIFLVALPECQNVTSSFFGPSLFGFFDMHALLDLDFFNLIGFFMFDSRYFTFVLQYFITQIG